MKDAREGHVGGHYAGKVIVCKIMHVGSWCPTVLHDTKEYCKSFDVCQCVKYPSKMDEIPLNPQVTL